MGQACCHAKAKMNCADKTINCILGCALPLGKLGDPELTDEARFTLLKDLRVKLAGFSSNEAKYKAQAVWWTVEAMKIPRPAEKGGDIPIVVHVPKEGVAKHAAVMFLHGGGLIMGVEMDDQIINIQTGVAKFIKEGFCVVSVGYRLAPEAKFPCAIEDAMFAYDFMMSAQKAADWKYAPGKVGIVGVSAGALVAGHTAVRLAKAGVVPHFVQLLCPMIDPKQTSPAHRDFDAPACPSGFIKYCWQALLTDSFKTPPKEEQMKEASMLHLDWSALKGAKILNLTSRYEVFYDDGMELNTLLQAAGVQLDHVVAEATHMQCAMNGGPDKVAFEKCIKWLSDAVKV